MKTLPTESHPDLIALINETYTDDVEQILSAAADDDGNIICLAQDGGKQLAVKISDTEIQVKLYNPALVEVETQFAAPDDDDEDEDEDEEVETEFQQADIDLDDVVAQLSEDEAEFKKNCVKGLSCGGSCISREKMCIRSLDPEARAAVKMLKDLVRKNNDPEVIAALQDIKNAQSRAQPKPKAGMPAAQIIEDFEKRKHNQAFESALAIDRDGNLAFEKDGSRSQVSFNSRESTQMAGGMLTHNHPSGESFSPNDIYTACNLDLTEIRAIGSEFLYKLEKPPSGWPSKKQSEKLIAKIRKENHSRYDREFYDRYGSGTQADCERYNAEVNKKYWHDLATAYAERTGAKYTRIAHNYGN